jgi:hypothetical protein
MGGSLNLYAYCDNDPVNHRDPTGREPEPSVWVCRRAADLGPIDASHWFLKAGDLEAGVGQDPSNPIPFQTAVLPHDGQAAHSQCDPVLDVDEECVAAAMQTNNLALGTGEMFGERLGLYGPGNLCSDWVEEVLSDCGGPDMRVLTSNPSDYDSFGAPDELPIEEHYWMSEESDMSEDPGMSLWE